LHLELPKLFFAKNQSIYNQQQKYHKDFFEHSINDFKGRQ